MFNVEDKTFTVVPYTSLPQYAGSHVIFGSVRRASDGLKLNLPVPYIENDKLYGMVPLSSSVKNDPNALVKGVAHRGYSAEAPENTIPAFELAREKGYAYTECDVIFTSDGVPVILHDDTIDRTSNGTGNVADFTLAELKALDFGSWKSEAYAGVQIPTFDEFIKTCKRLSLRPYIELKPAMSASQIEQLVDIVKRYNMLDHSVWTSFNYANLTHVIATDPNADVCNATTSITPEYIQKLVDLKTGSNVVYAYPYYPLLTSEAVTQIRENGLSIAVWTVNEVSDVMNMADLGVDAILTDKLNISSLLES